MKAATALTALALSMMLLSLPASAGSVRLDYGNLRVADVLPAFAQDLRPGQDLAGCKDEDAELEKIAKEKKKRPEGVPEINAAGATVALALLGGILLLWHERRRSKS